MPTIGMGVGGGFAGFLRVEAVRRLGSVEVVGGASSSRESAQRKVSKYGIAKAYSSYEELIADPAIPAADKLSFAEPHTPLSCYFIHVLHSFHRVATCVNSGKFLIIIDESHPHLCIDTAEQICCGFCASLLASFRRGRRLPWSRLPKTTHFLISSRSRRFAIFAPGAFDPR